jgi:hypothetical protein
MDKIDIRYLNVIGKMTALESCHKVLIFKLTLHCTYMYIPVCTMIILKRVFCFTYFPTE